MRILGLLLMCFPTVWAQGNSNAYIAKGKIQTQEGLTIDFINLKYKKDKVYFENLNRNAPDSLEQNQIAFVKIEIKGVPPPDAEVNKKADPLLEKAKKVYSTNVYLDSLPEGIFRTKDDFIHRIAVVTPKYHPYKVTPFQREALYEPEHFCFFLDENEDKIKNVFAIKWHGHLYFSIKAILKNRNEDDVSQESENPNAFVKVEMSGTRFYYTEVVLANKWNKALWVGGVGGAVGVVGATLTNHGKGCVWDRKKLEFNIFRHCDDFNDFLDSIQHPELKGDCDGNDYPTNAYTRARLEKVMGS